MSEVKKCLDYDCRTTTKMPGGQTIEDTDLCASHTYDKAHDQLREWFDEAEELQRLANVAERHLPTHMTGTIRAIHTLLQGWALTDQQLEQAEKRAS